MVGNSAVKVEQAVVAPGAAIHQATTEATMAMVKPAMELAVAWAAVACSAAKLARAARAEAAIRE